MSKRFLVLQNGAVFEGTGIGASSPTIGELVFTTGAGGYMGTLTDPTSAGQIVLQTFPEIGNFGVIPEETESPGCHFSDCASKKLRLAGYVVRTLCDHPSNFRSEGKLEEFLKQHDIPGIAGVDTRQITRILRDEGSMNAAIVSEVSSDLIDKLKAHKSNNFLQQFSAGTLEPCSSDIAQKGKTPLCLINHGAPHGLVKELQARGCQIIEGDCQSTADNILSFKGIVFSDGPGDPADAPKEYLALIRQLSGKLPILAIGLGHQLLALALGGKTEKLSHGHRGANQPVKRMADGRIFITSQNQGYCVKDAPPGAEVTFLHIGDNSIAALSYPKYKAISVEFTPTDDTANIYEEYLKEVHA